jgi:hypothetical protein
MDSFKSELKQRFGPSIDALQSAYNTLRFKDGEDAVQFSVKFAQLCQDLDYSQQDPRTIREFIRCIDNPQLRAGVGMQRPKSVAEAGKVLHEYIVYGLAQGAANASTVAADNTPTPSFYRPGGGASLVSNSRSGDGATTGTGATTGAWATTGAGATAATPAAATTAGNSNPGATSDVNRLAELEEQLQKLTLCLDQDGSHAQGNTSYQGSSMGPALRQGGYRPVNVVKAACDPQPPHKQDVSYYQLCDYVIQRLLAAQHCLSTIMAHTMPDEWLQEHQEICSGALDAMHNEEVGTEHLTIFNAWAEHVMECVSNQACEQYSPALTSTSTCQDTATSTATRASAS